jgi:small-conductance mechanosensitive channel
MAEKNKNHEGRAIVGFTLGILGIIFAMISPFAGIVISIFGLIQSSKEKNELGKKAKRLNIIGIILGIIVLVITILLIYLGVTSKLFPTA